MTHCCSCPHEYVPLGGCKCVCHTPEGEYPFIVWFHIDAPEAEDANPVRGACGSGVVRDEDEAIAVVRHALAAWWNVPEDKVTHLNVTRDPDELLGLEAGGASGVWL